jgi:hypothetical protein
MTYTNALKRQLTAVNREITDTSESGNTHRNAQFFLCRKQEERGGRNIRVNAESRRHRLIMKIGRKVRRRRRERMRLR